MVRISCGTIINIRVIKPNEELVLEESETDLIIEENGAIYPIEIKKESLIE